MTLLDQNPSDATGDGNPNNDRIYIQINFELIKKIQRNRKCGKCFLFDFGVIPQVLSTQRTMIVNNRFRRSHSVDNSCGLTLKSNRSLVVGWPSLLIFEHIFSWNHTISPVNIWEIWMRKQNQRYQLLDSFHNNYGSILLRFRDMTTGRTTDWRTDGRTTDRR